MKCLSVSQPYADLIVSGKKTIELRKWNTKFRGEFLVHAPMSIREEACNRLKIDRNTLRTGVIIGRVEIFDVKKYQSATELKKDKNKHLASEDFSQHKYGFLLKNPRVLRIPIPYKGRLGFFEVNIYQKPSKNDIESDLFDEEYRYQWIGKH